MVCINLNEDIPSGVPRRFLNSVIFVLDHFTADPAFTPINVIGHRLVSLCHSVCAEDWAQILDPILTS